MAARIRNRRAQSSRRHKVRADTSQPATSSTARIVPPTAAAWAGPMAAVRIGLPLIMMVGSRGLGLGTNAKLK